MPIKVNQPTPGQALKALRIAAGFDTAAAAAARHNWPGSRYASHESGARPILGDDAKRYAAAFGAEEKHLLSPSGQWLNELRERNDFRLRSQRRDRARRLLCARILAGYPSYAEVARRWGLSASTYLKHEQADNAQAAHFIELYASIFGVRAEWLRSGELPSGLGPEIDGQIADVMMHPKDFRRPAFQPPDGEKVAALRKAAAPGRPGVSTFGIPEVDWSELERAGGRIQGLPHRPWSMPSSFFSDLGLDRRSTFIVVADVPRDGLVVGERLVVSSDDAVSAQTQILAYRQGRLAISDTGSDASKVGAILWRLAPIRRTN